MTDGNYIQVILPLRLDWMPCYRCDSVAVPGMRVSVVFAHRRYLGVVWKTGITPDIDPSRIQAVLELHSDLPPVSSEELQFWEFLSSYYLCSIGEVYKAAYPAGKLRSEQKAAGILERLRQRLSVREEALTRKHKDSVRERLEAERDAISRQIRDLTRIPAGAVPKPRSGKPKLIVGGARVQSYIERCREALALGLNVLVLTPEIAAGEQLQELFGQAFPNQVHSVNSHITETRRRRIADDLRCYGAQLVVGTRSSLFLPFSRLGLIIVENEQDMLFKQTEPSPRYNARDAAVMLGRIHGAAVILGSPSPSLESLHNADSGKYELIRAYAPLPPMEVVDVSVERRKNGMVGRLSRKLLEAASRTGGPIALIRGWEKPEELAEEVAAQFEGRSVDIFTLQQARLADLRGYGLVAVLQADALFPSDDFRADERAVQALAMLREQCGGSFMVQTAKSEHPVFSSFETIYPKLLEERRSFGLPPFTRLIDTDFGGHRERLTLASDGSLAKRKQKLWERALAFEKKSGGRARVIIDVDPIL